MAVAKRTAEMLSENTAARTVLLVSVVNMMKSPDACFVSGGSIPLDETHFAGAVPN